MPYQIKLQNFEGPFDLLFHLIEKAEVDIYDIPIAEITNQYLEYINKMRSIDLDVASEFILMAATLIQIKSKMLLPKEKNPLDGTNEDADPRAELIEKLIEYKKFKEVSGLFKESEEKSMDIFYKNAEIIDDIEEDEILLNVSLNDLITAFNDIIERYKSGINEDVHLEEQLIREEFTVYDKILHIKQRLNNKNEISFSQLFISNTTKFEIVITFLALLELMRTREISIYQTKSYGEIIIRRNFS
ncbi:segregation and condensation protein A [Oxobacter pfennigii]|uniref:Segregation and condensation protein A n=1 Tax=Oxobacter pfennigii TaxID=36849 RepID=A0A0P8WAX5_9CLOT|nr:segregation/condensation protein A [Oxobacter pfennigii]KPU44873.1 segregation and condensation protein A [Oxobacter pfennigii]